MRERDCVSILGGRHKGPLMGCMTVELHQLTFDPFNNNSCKVCIMSGNHGDIHSKSICPVSDCAPIMSQ